MLGQGVWFSQANYLGSVLVFETETAGVRIVWSAAGYGEKADLSGDDLVLGRGGGGHSGGGGTGNDEGEDESANGKFHGINSLVRDISLDVGIRHLVQPGKLLRIGLS